MSFRLSRPAAGCLLSALLAITPSIGIAQGRPALSTGGQGPIGQLSVGGGTAVPIYAFSFGAQNVISDIGGSGGGAGKASISDISLLKLSDSQSTSLLRDTLTGQHLPAVQIDLFQNGGTIGSSFALGTVVVTSFQTTSAQTESITLHFDRLTFTSGGLSFCWDVSGEKGC